MIWRYQLIDRERNEVGTEEERIADLIDAADRYGYAIEMRTYTLADRTIVYRLATADNDESGDRPTFDGPEARRRYAESRPQWQQDRRDESAALIRGHRKSHPRTPLRDLPRPTPPDPERNTPEEEEDARIQARKWAILAHLANPARPRAMTLRDMTPAQLSRLYAALHDRLARRYGTASWDWPTLRTVAPTFHAALSAINAEGCRQARQEGGPL